jgi:hypothetical protein
MEARDEERNGSYNEVHLEPEPFKHEPIIQDLNARYQIYIAARQDTGLDE